MLTTPDRPDDAVDRGDRGGAGRGAACPPADVSHVLHGTTLFTNAIIERKGARTALVTTKGFRDAIEIAREHRYDMYDLYMQRPRPIAPRHLRFEVDERVLVDGTVRRPVDPGEVRRLADRLRAERDRGGRRVPAPRLRESRLTSAWSGRSCGRRSRTSRSRSRASWSRRSGSTSARRRRSPTCTSSAWPSATSERLEDRLRGVGVGGGLYIMQSNGGLCEAETGGRYPVRLIESGPAAGALAAAHYGALARPPGPPVVRHGRHHRQGVRHRGRRAARRPPSSRSTAATTSRRAAGSRSRCR